MASQRQMKMNCTIFHMMESPNSICLWLREGRTRQLLHVPVCDQAKWDEQQGPMPKLNVKTEKMAHIHRKMDNKILLFASDIFKWSLFFLSFFRSDSGTDCLGRHADSIPDDIICTSPNLMCDRFIISFCFVCCQMVFVCFAFLVRPSTSALQIFVLLYCMGVCLIFCPLKSSRLFSLSLLFSQTVKKDGVPWARRSLAFVTDRYALSAISITPALSNNAKWV